MGMKTGLCYSCFCLTESYYDYCFICVYGKYCRTDYDETDEKSGKDKD